jgi:DNA-binding CsgD family transcriptional regulator
MEQDIEVPSLAIDQKKEIAPPQEGERNNLLFLVPAKNEFMTPMVARVLCYSAMGLSNQEIAEKLGKSPYTIKDKLRLIYENIEKKKGPTERPANFIKLLLTLREFGAIYFTAPPNEEQFEGLGDRQKEAIELKLSGLSLKEIASSMGISRNTVRNLLTMAYKNMGITTHRTGEKLERPLFAHCYLGNSANNTTLKAALFKRKNNGAFVELPEDTDISHTSSTDFFWEIITIPGNESKD